MTGLIAAAAVLVLLVLLAALFRAMNLDPPRPSL